MKILPYFGGGGLSVELERLRASSTHLCLAIKKELEWIDSISDGTANDRYPVKHDRRFVRDFEGQLLKHIEENDEYDDRGESKGNRMFEHSGWEKASRHGLRLSSSRLWLSFI